MVLSHPSTPQHRTAPRNLWPSPAFSDYFSSNEEHESQSSPGLTDGAKINPLQHRIFFLLNEIGLRALHVDSGDQNAGLLEEELGHIVQRLNAPKTQSRAPAELADSGLFIDDDDAEDEVQQSPLDVNTERNARELQGGQDVIARISRVTEQLQLRYEDIHNINLLAISRLQSAADEIVSLRSENEHFHLDLSDSYNAMLALKMQISTIEVQAAPYISSEDGKSLRQDMERWKSAWRDAERRLGSRRHFHEHSSQNFLRGTDTGIGNDPFIEQQSKFHLDDEPDQERELEDELREALGNGNAQCRDSKVNQYVDYEEVIKSDDDETSLPSAQEENSDLEAGEVARAGEEDESDAEKSPRKSAWQELWDGLHEYAGVLDYSD